MFILSLKTSKKKMYLYFALVLALILLGAFILSRGCSKTYAISENGKYDISAQDNSSRLNFLSQFGWIVNENPVEISDILIPSEFNKTYESYNAIQQSQGLNLCNFKGKSCKKYSYDVINYKDKPDGVRANLIVYNGSVIAGDISDIALNGFMHGFENPNK